MSDTESSYDTESSEDFYARGHFIADSNGNVMIFDRNGEIIDIIDDDSIFEELINDDSIFEDEDSDDDIPVFAAEIFLQTVDVDDSSQS